LKKKGTIEEPIIALRYSIGREDYNNFVAQYKYVFNIKEYLTYKNYEPFTAAHPGYYWVMAWVFISIAGFSWSTGTLIKRGYITKEGTYDPTGSRWKNTEKKS